MAEETGLIIPLGQWALTQACQQLRQWQQAYPSDPPLTISVNLSVLQFAQPDISNQVAQILAQTGLSPSNLNLEITESALIEDDDLARTTLSRLHELGVCLQIDDFGTGYSSLSYLHQFPIGTLKIDRSFIQKMSMDTAALDGVSGTEIVRTIITLARELQMQVVAEGVENANQVKKLRALGCDMIQGYLVSRPLDGRAAGELLKRNLQNAVQLIPRSLQ